MTTSESITPDIVTHICPICHHTKPLTPEFFHRDAYRTEGFHSICKTCVREVVHALHEERKDNNPKRPPETRVCSRCKKELPLTADYFVRNAKRRHGFIWHCNACHNAACRAYQAAHAERTCITCKTCLPLTHEFFYRDKNRPGGLSYVCKPCAVSAAKLYGKAHRAAKYAVHRAWVHNNPERMRLHYKMATARRRARQKALRNTLTADQIALLLALHKHCVYCGKRLKKPHLDHLTPLSNGGPTTLQNILPCCGSCNSKKHVGPVLAPVQPLLL